MKYPKIWALIITQKDLLGTDAEQFLYNIAYLKDVLSGIVKNQQVETLYSYKRKALIFYTVNEITAKTLNPRMEDMDMNWGKVMTRIRPRDMFYSEILENWNQIRETDERCPA